MIFIGFYGKSYKTLAHASITECSLMGDDSFRVPHPHIP